MCLRTSRGRPPTEMRFETFRDIMQRDFDYPHYLLLYGQGEPFLCRDLFRMIRWEHERGRYVVTVTNGTLLDAETCAEIAASGLDLLRISIDGATRDTYAGVRQNGALAQVVDNVERLQSVLGRERARTRLAVTFMALRENYFELPAVVRLVHRLGVNTLEIKEVPRYADERMESLSLAMELDAVLAHDVEAVVQEARREARRHHVRLITARFGPPRGKPRCMNPWFKCYVGADGRVSPCSKLCLSLDAEAGSLVREPFDRIWNGDAYHETRRRILAGRVPFDACSTR